ncbi:MAG: hypothetical protein WBE92_06485 [Steroidobacteraceae bacterium]
MGYRQRLLACAGVLLLAGGPLLSEAAQTGTARLEAPQTAGEPATWITRDVELKLQNLPKVYSCDDLWYKLHGILLAIGARQYMSIRPYYCGHGAANAGRSPMVDLRFQTLRALSGANAKWADTTAVDKVVRLGPGEPKILDTGDCALLEQLDGTLFASLNMHVVATDLDCSSPRSAARFNLSVQALTPQPAQSSGT